MTFMLPIKKTFRNISVAEGCEFGNDKKTCIAL